MSPLYVIHKWCNKSRFLIFDTWYFYFYKRPCASQTRHPFQRKKKPNIVPKLTQPPFVLRLPMPSPVAGAPAGRLVWFRFLHPTLPPHIIQTMTVALRRAGGGCPPMVGNGMRVSRSTDNYSVGIHVGRSWGVTPRTWTTYSVPVHAGPVWFMAPAGHD
jgi:hypothetical protein